MRPLLSDFPSGTRVWEVDDALLLGPDLLIAPVLHEGALSRRVYLPEVALRTHAWTGEQFNGGSTVDVEPAQRRTAVLARRS